MREEATIYGPFSHLRGSQKKKSSYLGKLLQWEMETITKCSLLLQYKKIPGSVSMTTREEKHRENDRHLTPKTAIEDSSVYTDTDQ